MWRKEVVRKGFPVREKRASKLGLEEHQFIEQALGILCVSTYDGAVGFATWFKALANPLRQPKGIRAGSGAGPRKALARCKGGKGHRQSAAPIDSDGLGEF